jgi:hypothetical protein
MTYETAIAGTCCSQVFIAITDEPVKFGTLIACKHCSTPIELAYDNCVEVPA